MNQSVVSNYIGGAPLPQAETEAGMAAMSKALKETGSELYLPADD